MAVLSEVGSFEPVLVKKKKKGFPIILGHIDLMEVLFLSSLFKKKRLNLLSISNLLLFNIVIFS